MPFDGGPLFSSAETPGARKVHCVLHCRMDIPRYIAELVRTAVACRQDFLTVSCDRQCPISRLAHGRAAMTTAIFACIARSVRSRPDVRTRSSGCVIVAALPLMPASLANRAEDAFAGRKCWIRQCGDCRVIHAGHVVAINSHTDSSRPHLCHIRIHHA
ncbi:hypothetical protein BD310DRAFT_656674 [Dichomitus squalens]|uniref:Uncharacterized protein n=1 Tax=Dichomitus squalens TaxID=114155 RepID=A0A4Q9Q6C4_9APHY|nr:hypothetical protein BD310DRAFT_656674 [Dichomitus squalens]